MQSTIDMLDFWKDSKLAKAKGSSLVHPYNLGPKRNFQVNALFHALLVICTLCPEAQQGEHMPNFTTVHLRLRLRQKKKGNDINIVPNHTTCFG